MKTSALSTLLAVLCLGVLRVGHLRAQEAEKLPLVPLPSILDFTGGGGWGLAVGAGVEYENAYDGSDEYEFEIDPALVLQWRRGNHLLFFEGNELGWRGLFADIWLLQGGLRYEYGLEPGDSDKGRLDGFEKRDSHIVGFFEFRRSVGEDWRNWVGGRVMGGESGFGWLGVLAAGHRFGAKRDGTGTELLVFSTFGNSTFISKDFGVTAADAAGSGLAETALSGGYRSTGANLIHRREITRRLELVSEIGVEWYSSDIGDSPVARNQWEAEVGLSLVYKF